MAFSPVGDQLDERHSPASAGAVDSLLGDLIGRDNIVSISPDTGNSISRSLVLEAGARSLFRGGRRIGVSVVFDDHHQRTTLHRRKVDPLMERSSRRGTV